MQQLAEQFVRTIIKDEMALDDQTIWIRSQTRKIPDGDGMYVTVGMVDAPRVLSSNLYTREDELDPPKLIQCQQLIMRENIQIDIFSRDNTAIMRRWEVVAALTSYRAIQNMELNNWKIFKTPSNFVDTSGAEGGGTLNRYTITIPCLVWYYKENPLPFPDFYDVFESRVDDAKTLGTDTPIAFIVIDGNTEPTYN